MPDAITPGGVIGRDTARQEARAKVTGAAQYPSDIPLPGVAHAFLVTSGISRGRILRWHLEAGRAVPGVLDILTHENAAQDSAPIPPTKGGGGSTTTLQSDHVWHDGQIIAVVIAESFEAAREAAHKVRADYAEEVPAASFDSPGVEIQVLEETLEAHEDPKVGDAAAAFAAGTVTVDATYGTPIQHHNPIELFTTTCFWEGDRLTILEPSQFVQGLASTVAKQIGTSPDKVRVISPLVGGAFGSKGGATARTSWVAVAARRLGRPVKLVANRSQGFTIATYRAETRQRVRLAAGHDGRLQALLHEGWEVSSRPSNYNVQGTETTARIYACPNVWTRVSVVHADRNTPGFMRAPPDLPYGFGLESAMDELAVALDMDPVELRRINDARNEPIKGLPYTSRSLLECFDAAGSAFGWSRRERRPGSMREGDWRIGWGCAASYYPAKISAACARVTLTSGGARLDIAAHEIGTGAWTVLAMTAADQLGLEPEQVEVHLGDSTLPAAGLAAGSSHTASICNAVALACRELRDRLALAVATENAGPFAGQEPAALRLEGGTLRGAGGVAEPLSATFARTGPLDAYAEYIPHGNPPDAPDKLRQGTPMTTGGAQLPDRIQYGFGAQFVEVRVHARTGEVRVPRITGAFAAGRIMNPRTAHSQLMGGMIWGIGSALLEATEIDRRNAHYVNDNLSEYLIAVNADVPAVEVIIVPEEDRLVNPLGIKGIGELGCVGTNAAIANAVFHATGRRLRELPIRPEHLL
ncbi:xanthine dehydrogenase family protein molybdopterin-binding subunit [Roseomonas sp. M0104]|uniref:Xanthine dehydrogenase family protein molybdopterin-binding subunit n=1 Tax=Teichococcus coralli TaxID=2545983 RepID=A0A845B8N7_9PROT|nr:xanthine dehydrogenase family protein molybdopterin-binding subunit [Pseudoroseomonas coralli]MXP63085.1 xanthine dehydrogenase family protein molybdopterin-binding subunit [Pseudoroseomonas coralli]